MPPGRGVNNSILLARIDERTENTQNDVQEIKEKQKETSKILHQHNDRLIHLEERDNKNIHVNKKHPLAGLITLILRLIK